ncbi:MAG: alpha/beta fold hydrolase [Chrysiogenia bacterium]
MRAKLVFLLILSLAGVLSAQSIPESGDAAQQPRYYVYREVDGEPLNAYVFPSQGANPGKPTAAILCFHGGGWVAGSAEWTAKEAKRFAALGLTAVTIDYRLSKGKITPIEALDDTRAAFRWLRRHAAEFNIDPKRVAGYGVSAGGHLVAAAATLEAPGDGIDDTSSKPDLLLLWSPALDVAADSWFVRLLQSRASAADYSPLQHAGAATPPTCIVNGDKDTLTPLSKAERFRVCVIQAGGVCELHVYPGVGHLLTRNLANQEDNFDPDPKFKADGIAQLERFLRERGFLSKE